VPKRTLDSHYITALGDETRGVEVTAIMQAVLDPPAAAFARRHQWATEFWCSG
jgi:hypothetical protein